MQRISLFVLLLGFTAFGQETPEQQIVVPVPGGTYHRFQLGVSASGDVNYRILSNHNDSQSSDMIITMRDSLEKPRMGYTTGITAVYNFSAKLGIETGALYSAKGYTAKYAFTGGNGLKSVQYSDVFHYIDVPVRVHYKWGKKRMRFVAGAGVSVGFLAAAREIHTIGYTDGHEETTRIDSPYDFNDVTLSALASCGIDWELGPRMNLRIEPTFRCNVLPINDDPITGYLWNAGLNAGLYMSL